MSGSHRPKAWSVVVAVTASVSVVLVALVAVAELDIAPVISSRPPSSEWFALSRDRILLLAVVTALGACAVTAGWDDLDRRRTAASGTTVSATLLAAGLGSLPAALWSSQAWVRGAAFAVAALIPVALAHLAHSTLRDRLAPTVRRPMTRVSHGAAWTTAYLLVIALAVVHRLVDDPFLDPRCLEYCAPGAPLVDSAALARATDLVLPTAAAVAGGLTAVAAAVALVRATEVSARLAALAAVFAGALEIVWALGPVSAPVLGPTPFQWPDLLALRLLGHGAVALSVAALVVLHARRRLRLGRMAREIVAVTPPNSVREVLAQRLDDPGAGVEYAVGDERLWVDDEGQPVRVSGDRAQQVAVVSRGGRRIARVRFSTGRVRAADVEDALGPAAVLALDAERTRAELLMRLRALQDLRRRVVEESDAARRRAERDLHDGAQHLLLAAGFALQEGLHAARHDGDVHASERLEHALADVAAIAADLRAVAHGMYPVLLGDAGLVQALEGLARSGAVPTSVDADPVGRVHPSIELTLYQACAVASRSTEHGALAIALRREGDDLRLTLTGPSLPLEPLDPLRDRVAALGGTMETMAGSVLLEVPCA